MSASRIQVYQYFQEGDIPTEMQFRYLFDNLWFKDEQMSISDITGLEQMFQNTLSVEQLDSHIQDEAAHSQYLAKLDGSNIDPEAWKAILEIVRIATVDEGDFEGNVYDKDQVAHMINDVIANINQLKDTLSSDDVNLDELQEIVNYIKDLKTETGINDLVSEDNSLLIDHDSNNIESNISIYSEEFENFTNTIVSISFPAIQVLGVYDGGLKLNSNEYELVTPIRIRLLAPRKHTLSEFFPDTIEIQYTHLKTDL